MRSLILVGIAVLAVASEVSAATVDPTIGLFSNRTVRNPLRVDWSRLQQAAEPAQPLHAAAIEHSDAYKTRLKIHKVASFATLPLFAAELALGQSLYNTSGNVSGKRGAHVLVGAGIVGLLGVNTVTGLWNMLGEDRKDPNNRKLRVTHALLMLASDAGMAATWAYGPNSNSQRQALTFESRKVTHRNLAYASISLGTAGYLIMLFGHH